MGRWRGGEQERERQRGGERERQTERERENEHFTLKLNKDVTTELVAV